MPPNFFKSFADAYIGAAQGPSQSRGLANQLLLFDLQRKAAAARQKVANEQAQQLRQEAHKQALERLEIQRKNQIGQLQEQARLEQVSRDRLLPPGLQQFVAQRFGVDITTPGGEGLRTGTQRPFPITFGELAGFESAAKAFPRPKPRTPVSLSPGQKLVDPGKGTVIYSAPSEPTVPKPIILAPGHMHIDQDGKVIKLNPPTAKSPKRTSVPPGHTVIDEKGTVIYSAPAAEEKGKDPKPVTIMRSGGEFVTGQILNGRLQVPDPKSKTGFSNAGPRDVRVDPSIAVGDVPRARERAENRKLEISVGTYADQVGILSNAIAKGGLDADLGLGWLGKGAVAFTNFRAQLTAGGRLLGNKLDAPLDLSSYEGIFKKLKKAAHLNDNIRGAVLDLAFLKAASIRGNRISDKEINKQIRAIVGGVTTGRAFVENIKRSLRRFDLRFQRQTLASEGFRRSVLYKTPAQVKVALMKGFFGNPKRGGEGEDIAAQLLLGIRDSQRR